MGRRRLAALVVAAVIVESPRATGEPYVPAPLEVLHLKSSSTARTDKGSDLRLPPGYFMDEPKFAQLDSELKTLQDARTRLEAENASLRKSASQDISFGWIALSTALVLGLSGGYYLGTR